ncbi:MAG: DNA-processing protein DprA, partial [Desulfobacterota bacterium]|nr:DNA-processing protein DprA [Thermodesulfobacteriota bacterium]
NVIFNRLIKTFTTPEKVFQVSAEELRKVEGIGPQTIEAILNFRENEEVEKELYLIEKYGVKLLTITDENFPENLKQIYDPPPFLYVRGEIKKEDNLAIAIVGSRNASSYGRSITKKLARALTERGFTVISGLARGIDTFAHKGALEIGGRTIAVLGSGIDIIYPRENKILAEEIISSGALVTEFPFGTKPEATNFPSRNRIISGLSLGTVIVEASFRSGSLITARLALEQGREVFAVPGNIDSPGSKGTNRLIKEGAKLVVDAEDIIEEISPQYSSIITFEPKKTPKPNQLTSEGQNILGLLDINPVHIDQLIQKSGLLPNQVTSLLLELELAGTIKQLPGKMFIKVP